MKTSKIVTHGGVSLDLSTIKCFKLQSNLDLGKNNILIVEHKTRMEYIENPNSGKFEKQTFNETTDIEFVDYETAKVYQEEWEQIWQDYLND